MNGDLIVVEDVAEAFAKEVASCFARRPGPHFSLFLSGGPTAKRCYEALANHDEGVISWEEVDLFWGDERCVALDHPDSNYLLAKQALIDKIGRVGSIHPMSCEQGAQAYDALVGSLGEIDLLHLGLGPDGHTASLFKGSPGLDSPGQALVVLNEDPSGRNPHPRMTLTLAGIALAREVVLTVAGPEKKEAMGKVMRGEDVPGSLVKAKSIKWLVEPSALP
jgi:6-phosphogluconolactonase